MFAVVLDLPENRSKFGLSDGGRFFLITREQASKIHFYLNDLLKRALDLPPEGPRAEALMQELETVDNSLYNFSVLDPVEKFLIVRPKLLNWLFRACNYPPFSFKK